MELPTRHEPVHIPLAAPATASTLLRIHGRGGIVRQQLPSPPRAHPEGQYSSHECIGDISDLKPKAQRVCLFRRVCLDTQSGDWQYYRRANVSLPPVLFERRYGSQFSFQHVAPRGTEEFLALNKHVRYKPHVRWSPIVVDGAAPVGVHWAAPVHLLSAPFVPTNLGHLVWEEAFPLLLAMAQLGAYDERAVVLRTHACNESVKPGEPLPTESEARLCEKFVAGFVAPLQARERSGVDLVAALRARHWPRHVCFRRLVAGGYFDMFNAPPLVASAVGPVGGPRPVCLAGVSGGSGRPTDESFSRLPSAGAQPRGQGAIPRAVPAEGAALPRAARCAADAAPAASREEAGPPRHPQL